MSQSEGKKRAIKIQFERGVLQSERFLDCTPVFLSKNPDDKLGRPAVVHS